jgi:uncharacterized phage protein gp47/JayE
MPFDRPTITTIKERIEKGIEARLFGKVALLRVAILRILARVFAGAIHGNYGYLEWLSRQLFVSTAETEYLDRHGLMWDIERRAGSFASGTAIFFGTESATVPEDTRVQNENGVEYGTITDALIVGGSANIEIQAIESGIDGNYVRPNPGDTLTLQLISPVSEIYDDVNVDGDITGGTDSEDDETYRARILQRIQTIPAGGAEADYVRWATEFTGVERAWCYPLEDGPGTVVTVITASGDDPVPSSLLLTDVDAYISERKPVTASHRTASIQDYSYADGKTILTMSIRITPLSSNIQQNIITNISQLFLPHRPGTDIPISQIRAAISNTGVIDYSIDLMYLDGVWQPISDLVLTGFQYPWLGTISFTELT